MRGLGQVAAAYGVRPHMLVAPELSAAGAFVFDLAVLRIAAREAAE